MERIKNWLNHPVFTMKYWAYICFYCGSLLVGMMGMFIAMTYSEIKWDIAQRISWLTITMLIFGLMLVMASYFGTKKTK